MSLRRTASGLFSIHRFYKVDIVVFCEGGKSVAAADAHGTLTDIRTLDTIFWSTAASYLSTGKSYHFKSIGSKSTIISLAEDAQLNNLSTVTFCIDRDYDGVIGRAEIFQRLASTLGYSWESDVLSKYTVVRLLNYLVGAAPQSAINNLNTCLSGLEGALLRWTEFDIALRYRYKTSVFDRKKISSSIDFNASPPGVAHSRLAANLSRIGYKRGPKRVVQLQQGAVLYTCFGKLVSRLIYHVTIHHAQALMPSAKIDYDNFMKMAISDTFSQIALGGAEHLSAHLLAQQAAFA